MVEESYRPYLYLLFIAVALALAIFAFSTPHKTALSPEKAGQITTTQFTQEYMPLACGQSATSYITRQAVASCGIPIPADSDGAWCDDNEDVDACAKDIAEERAQGQCTSVGAPDLPVVCGTMRCQGSRLNFQCRFAFAAPHDCKPIYTAIIRQIEDGTDEINGCVKGKPCCVSRAIVTVEGEGISRCNTVCGSV